MLAKKNKNEIKNFDLTMKCTSRSYGFVKTLVLDGLSICQLQIYQSKYCVFEKYLDLDSSKTIIRLGIL